MVIARFNRTLAIGLFLLIAIVIAIVGGLAILISRDGDWSYNLPAVAMLAGLFISICTILIACQDPRAIWIENGVLRFYESSFDHDLLFLVFRRKVPLGAIAGLSSTKAEFTGAVERPGIYVNLKSGGSYKVVTFLLAEPRQVVLARLRGALGLSQAEA